MTLDLIRTDTPGLRTLRQAIMHVQRRYRLWILHIHCKSPDLANTTRMNIHDTDGKHRD